MAQSFYEPAKLNGHAHAETHSMIGRIAAYVAAAKNLRTGTRIAGDILQEAAEAARRRPVPVIAAALGIGLVIGLLISPRAREYD